MKGEWRVTSIVFMIDLLARSMAFELPFSTARYSCMPSSYSHGKSSRNMPNINKIGIPEICEESFNMGS